MADKAEIRTMNISKEALDMPALIEILKKANVISLEIKQELLDVTPENGKWDEYEIGKTSYNIVVKNG